MASSWIVGSSCVSGKSKWLGCQSPHFGHRAQENVKVKGEFDDSESEDEPGPQPPLEKMVNTCGTWDLKEEDCLLDLLKEML